KDGKRKRDNDDRKKEFCPEKYGSAPLEILKTTPHFCAALSSYGGGHSGGNSVSSYLNGRCHRLYHGRGTGGFCGDPVNPSSRRSDGSGDRSRPVDHEYLQ